MLSLSVYSAKKAANILGVGRTTLRATCRLMGILKWPGRTIPAVVKNAAVAAVAANQAAVAAKRDSDALNFEELMVRVESYNTESQ